MLAKFTTLLTNSVIRDISGALNPYNISLYTEGERETERERESERTRIISERNIASTQYRPAAK